MAALKSTRTKTSPFNVRRLFRVDAREVQGWMGFTGQGIWPLFIERDFAPEGEVYVPPVEPRSGRPGPAHLASVTYSIYLAKNFLALCHLGLAEDPLAALNRRGALDVWYGAFLGAALGES